MNWALLCHWNEWNVWAVPQRLHSGYKLLLRLPHGVSYGGKEAICDSILIRLSSNDLSLFKGRVEKGHLKKFRGKLLKYKK